jgi:stage II sporulation SpoD-like protein
VRIAPAMLAVFASVFASFFIVPAAGVNVVDARGGHCTRWKSTNEPPPDIAVYRVKEGRVDRVNFRLYVARVVSREWNIPSIELRRAGAVAVKQYAWYHVLHYRGGKFNGKCWDVRDTTADQLYAHKRVPREVRKAVAHTWTWRLRRADGKFPMTGYRRGHRRPGCGKEGGYRLYVRSAKKCAAKGWTAEQILTTYYTAILEK